MKHLLAAIRFAYVMLVIFFGTIFVLLTGWMPIYIQQIHLSVWVTSLMCRAILPMARVHVEFPPRAEVMAYEGLFFANHCTYFDIIAMSYMMPLRYLAKEEIAGWPFIGYLAKSIGCAFVKRHDKDSRAAARQQLTTMDYYPPLVLYPEGKRNSGYELHPFRYGAFEIATQGQIPFTPIAIIYDRPDIFASPHGENVLVAVWRVLSNYGPLNVKLVFLETVTPAPGANAADLAEQTRAAMLEVLSTQGNYKQEGDNHKVAGTTN